MLIFSVHSDTGFPSHSLKRLDNGLLEGQMDNFVGVYSMMKAYFSGRMTSENVRIELTYDEEGEFAGAYEVLDTLSADDVVIVVDVTGTPTEAGFVFEKCRDPRLRGFLRKALDGMSFDMYEDCPDPVSTSDEVDVYSQKCALTCFLGVPLFGGDYNAGAVMCKAETPDIAAEAICRIVEAFANADLRELL